MKKLDWYIFRKFIGTFFFAISLLIVVVIVFDVSENIDCFIENNATFYEVVCHFYLPFIPYFINLFVYLFTFISVIFFTSKLAGHSEIIAILSSGVSFRRFLRPYIVAALFLTVLSFYLGNFLIPRTDAIRREFKGKYIGNLALSSGRNIHVQIEKGTFVYVNNYDIQRKMGYRFCMEKFRDQEMVYKLSADRIEYDTITGRWHIFQYNERFIDNLNESLHFGASRDTVLALLPTDLYNQKESFEEMNLWELNDYIDAARLKGSENVKTYEIEMHKRLASPAAIIILTIIGAALSSRKTKNGMGINLGIGIVITFTYILFMEFTRVFALSGALPPVVAAWLPNVVYALIGIYFLRKAPK